LDCEVGGIPTISRFDEHRSDTSSIATPSPTKNLYEFGYTQLSVTKEMGVTNKDVRRRQIHSHGE
jgi:hypothetical protein